MADLFDERVQAVFRSERSRAELALLLVRCHEERLMPIKARSYTLMSEAVDGGLAGFFYNDLSDVLNIPTPTEEEVEKLKAKAELRVMNAICEKFVISDGEE